MQPKTPKPVRVNTFNMRPSLPQVLAYILMTGQVAVYFSCIFPYLLSASTKIPITVLYCSALTFMVVATFVTSYIDPTDPRTRYASLDQIPNHQSQPLSYCSFCYGYCSSDSRHCKICDRCVQGFDHHCIWINNCVGQKNYTQFIIMNWASLVEMLMFEVSGIVLTVLEPWHQFMANIVAVWVSMGVFTVFVALLVYLGGFHIHLVCNQMSTFEFFRGRNTAMPRRKDRQEPTLQAIKVQSRRKSPDKAPSRDGALPRRQVVNSSQSVQPAASNIFQQNPIL